MDEWSLVLRSSSPFLPCNFREIAVKQCCALKSEQSWHWAWDVYLRG